MTIEYSNITHLGHDKNWTVVAALSQIQNNGETAWALADNKLVMKTSGGHEEISFSGTDIQTLIQNGTASVECALDGIVTSTNSEVLYDGDGTNTATVNKEILESKLLSSKDNVCASSSEMQALIDAGFKEVYCTSSGSFTGTITIPYGTDFRIRSDVNNGLSMGGNLKILVGAGSGYSGSIAIESLNLNGHVLSLSEVTGGSGPNAEIYTVKGGGVIETDSYVSSPAGVYMGKVIGNAITAQNINMWYEDAENTIVKIGVDTLAQTNWRTPFGTFIKNGTSSVDCALDGAVTNTNSEAQYDADGTNTATVNKEILEAKINGDNWNYVNVSANVSPAVKNTAYRVDAGAGIIEIELPDVVSGNRDVFKVYMADDSHHIKVTTVGGTQLFCNGLAFVGIATKGSCMAFKANGVDEYEAVLDTTVYYRETTLTATTDLSGGYESGGVYLLQPPTDTEIVITIPDPSVQHIGYYAKFILDADNGGSVRIVTPSGTATIGDNTEPTIVIPYKGMEVMDDGTDYHITQDSRPSVASSAITFYALDEASVIVPYFRAAISTTDPDYSPTPIDVAIPIVTGLATPLGSFVSDEGVLSGLVTETNISSSGKFRRISGSGTATFYTEVYRRETGGTEHLLSTLNDTAAVSSASYVELISSGILPEENFASTDSVIVKLYGNRIAGGSDPTYEVEVEGTTPARLTFNIPSATQTHDSLAAKGIAGPGVTFGHVNDQVQIFAGRKTCADGITLGDDLAAGGNDIVSVGALAVGLSTPDASMSIVSGSGSSRNIWGYTSDYSSGVTGTRYQAEFGASSGNTYFGISNFINGGSNFGDMVLNIGGGNVGIGKTPTDKLDVNGVILSRATIANIDAASAKAVTTREYCDAKYANAWLYDNTSSKVHTFALNDLETVKIISSCTAVTAGTIINGLKAVGVTDSVTDVGAPSSDNVYINGNAVVSTGANNSMVQITATRQGSQINVHVETSGNQSGTYHASTFGGFVDSTSIVVTAYNGTISFKYKQF